jgi:hypothetical protein
MMYRPAPHDLGPSPTPSSMRAITALTHPRRGSRRSPSWRPPRSGTCIDYCRTSALDALRSAASSSSRSRARALSARAHCDKHHDTQCSLFRTTQFPTSLRPIDDRPRLPYPTPSTRPATTRARPSAPALWTLHTLFVRRVGTRPSHAVVSSSIALARESQRAAHQPYITSTSSFGRFYFSSPFITLPVSHIPEPFSMFHNPWTFL